MTHRSAAGTKPRSRAPTEGEEPQLASVLRLARECRYEQAHTHQVTRLALDLFEQLRSLHQLGERERFWLKCAGLLHDIGWIEGQQRHHKTVLRLDIGTNSIRLLIARINPNHTYATLTQQKETVRLGEGEFLQHRLRPPAMQRAVQVCMRFARMARSFGARKIIAVATAACREARNRRQFVSRLKREAQLDVHVPVQALRPRPNAGTPAGPRGALRRRPCSASPSEPP